MSHLPIGDYALLSDCHTAALVSRAGSADWLCCPRFDGPAVFGRLLDADAGHWSITPIGEFLTTRRYREATLVLETTFEQRSGTAVLTDALATGRNERGHEIGGGAPRALLRRVTCTRGSVELAIEYAPRPEYGIVRPLLSAVEHGITGRGGADVLTLSSTVPFDIRDICASASVTLREGESIGFALQHRSSWEARSAWWTQEEIARRIDDTAEAWRTWSALHQRYDGPWRELVYQSGRVLQALTYFPTGAIVAAPTTSLPETPGGIRNWDYRFTWVRDASLTLDALWVAACPDEAHRFLDFLAGAPVSQIRSGADLQIMFGIGGEHDLHERELHHLRGWRDSRPVRIGNGAWTQRQLDVYGELLGATHRLKDVLGGLDPATREFLVEATEAAAARWTEKDQGIWEVRGPPRDFLHSKLMCWVALDRAISLAGLLGADDRVARWESIRTDIREAILERGWSARAGSFTQSFDSDDLDASSLMIPIVGFLPANDPRVCATVHAIAERLCDARGLVYRYRSSDGLAGDEGTFLACTFWLAEALALIGDLDEARATFSSAASYANDLGLLAEEVDASTGELLGNFPQAFSHIGLVNAAWAIAQLENARRPRAWTDTPDDGRQAAPQGPLP